MKIIIVGGGIAGLSTYLHLRKHLPNHTVTVYESHKPRSTARDTSSPERPNQSVSLDILSTSTALVGGGLSISPNGMRVLRDLSLDLHDRVVAQGFPADNFVFKGANGWLLGMHSSSDKSVRDKSDAEEVCVASSRYGLWNTIRQYVIEKYREGVIRHRKVTKIERDAQKPTLRLRVHAINEMGQEEVDYADMVIGADGVKSVVRRAIFGDDDGFHPVYNGQSEVGGFLNTTIPPFVAEKRALVFTFGGNGSFGYSSSAPVSEKQLMWWSTFQTSTLPDSRDIDPRTIKDSLFERHQHWKDPVVQEIIRNADVQSIYPTWIMPELPYWGKQGMVLVGDAAHAMDPKTGQGASLALEDSLTLVLSLAEMPDVERHGSASERWVIDEAIELFYKVRSPRVKKIVERGKKTAGSKTSVGVVAEYTMYCILWLLMRFPSLRKIMVGDTNRELYCWSAKHEIQEALKTDDSQSQIVTSASELSPLLPS
ncbi:hypothetical protein OPT61_g7380 [Boeremia exigua]|uniref:Uncharacterized protein n=1 Tax=Boeremia exigua TaxID=749465 RepID=A0ACC2I3T0_9PLEO|nr:hypothetical protein OPT61_g7380 [Boeremia exigua]